MEIKKMPFFKKVMFRSLILSVIVFCITNKVEGQYILNGNATKDNCNCYTLTQDALNQYGSVWNSHKISLTQPFDYRFKIFLGYNGGNNGADGIAFVLQDISTSIGVGGGGMGYQGISPAVGVTIDTYQNTTSSDPSYDHIAIQLNGDIDHASANNIAGPVQALVSSPDIADGNWHILRVTWNPVTKEMAAYIDGSLRVSAVQDFANTVFSGVDSVYWGFTGSTGGLSNLQRFCTQSVADFNVDSTLSSFCNSGTITFSDSSYSFGSITNWNWNFGDGSTSNLPSPTHEYSSTGTYDVQLYVTGNDGCNSDTSNFIITIHPNPQANFVFNGTCIGDLTQFQDSSTTASGNISQWNWNFGDDSNSNTENPNHTYASNGNYVVTLTTKNNFGCTDSIKKTIYITPAPIASFTTTTACPGQSTQFINTSTDSINIHSIQWDFGDNSNSSVYSPNHSYAQGGSYTVKLVLNSGDACSDSTTEQITIPYLPNVNFGGQSLAGCTPWCATLIDSSSIMNGNIVNYEWKLGDGRIDTGQQIIACYNDSSHLTPKQYTITLKATSDKGCSDSAIKVNYVTIYPRPKASFVFNPVNGDIYHSKIHFIDESQGANSWKWNFGDGSSSTLENLLHNYSDSGTYLVSLHISNQWGCKDSIVHFVRIDPVFSLYIPNTFTPDEDGVNDYFYPQGFGIMTETMYIFNRWGELIYKAQGLNSKWNGVAAGVQVPTGVYVYKIIVTDFNGLQHTYTGGVTVVR